jgi:hypothetical protein
LLGGKERKNGNMNMTINPDLLKGLLALAGTAVGYAIREYQNRVVPFFQVFDIQGDSTAGWDIIDIPAEVLHELSDTFYIKELRPKEALTAIYKCWDRADDIKRFWPKIKPLLDSVLSSANNADLEETVYKLCDSLWFDQWFIKLVARAQLHFDKSATDLPIKIQVALDSEDKEKNGTLWINTIYGATSFGQQMNNPAMSQRFAHFVDNLQKLDGDRIKKPLIEFQAILEKEYQVALKVVDPLKKIMESCSRWMFHIAFTNLSNNPVVVEQNAEVYVTDKKNERKKPYRLKCQLAKVSNDKGERQVRHTNAPISFRQGETIEFAIVTKQAQREMDLGDDVRTVFNRGSGKCKVVLHLQKPGFIKKQTARSTMIPFKE